MGKKCFNPSSLFRGKLTKRELVGLIAEHGGAKQALNKRKSGHIPLSCAIVNGNILEIIKLMFENNKTASVEWRSPVGSTVLHLAAWVDRGDIVEYLLSQCPEMVNFKNRYGKTAMDKAQENHAPVAVALLSQVSKVLLINSP